MVRAGDRFDRLTVIRVFRPFNSAGEYGGGRKAEVECICGKTKVVNCADLTRKKMRSCGCLQKEKAAQRTAAQRNRTIVKNPSVTLKQTRAALDRSMTENTRLKAALKQILDMTNDDSDQAINLIAHKALQIDYHAERKARRKAMVFIS